MWNDSNFKNHISSIIEEEITPIIFQPPPPSDWGIFGDETVRVTNIRCAWYLLKYQTEVQIWKVWNFVLCPKSHFQHPALERPILPAGLFAKQSKSKETCERLNNLYFLFLFHVFCMILWYFSSEFGAQSKLEETVELKTNLSMQNQIDDRRCNFY